MRRFTKLRALKQPKALLFAVALAVFGLLAGGHASIAHACGEPSNDIMLCGFSSPANFRNTVNGSNELKNIYSAYGLEPADYDKFVTHAVSGYAQRSDNTLRLSNGTVVAHAVDSIGRNASFQGSGYFTQHIDGAGTYYGNTNDKAFSANAPTLAATILLDDQNNVVFAVLNDCGNPIGAPNYQCNMLHESQVSGTRDTFKFSSDVTANSTAKLKYVIYDYGDGTTSGHITDPSLVLTHQYAHPGTYQAKVTVYVSLPHAADPDPFSSADCKKQIIVTPPPPPPPMPSYTCVNLVASPIDKSPNNYQFVATGTAGNGASIHSATFDFGDTHSKTVDANGSKKITTTHQYDASTKKTYSASVILNIDLPGGKHDTVTASGCKKVPVVVNLPLYSCVGLTPTLLDEATHNYSFSVEANYNKYVTFQNAVFNFGDGTPTVKVTKGSDGKTETTTHAYTTLQDYTVTATLNFLNGKKAVSAACTFAVSPTGGTTCQSSGSQDTALCSPCASNSALPANSPDCTLPNTGAGDVIGVGAVAAIIGFFFYRQFIFRRRVAHMTASGAAIGGFVPPPGTTDDDEDNELIAQVVTSHHAKHRNATGLHHHAGYHKPRRFRPGSHRDK